MAARWGVSVRAARLHERAVVVDAHADTLTEMTDRGYDLERGPAGSQFDLERTAGGAVNVQILTAFVNPKCLPHGAARVRKQLDTLERQLALYPRRLELCARRGQIAPALAAGKLALVAAIEGGHALENDLDHLLEFRRRGVRTMTLTWNNSNEWADGCGDDGPHGGLTARGREVVAAMEELDMIVDVSHVARSTFDDVLATATRPLIASHSCARALRDHPRNLHDDQLRALAERGGVACLNFYPPFLVREGEATLDDLLDHLEHFVSVAGAEHVGLGSDFDGIPTTPVGMDDVSRLPRLTQGMLDRGFREADVLAILGGNLLRVFEGT